MPTQNEFSKKARFAEDGSGTGRPGSTCAAGIRSPGAQERSLFGSQEQFFLNVQI
jgi:hypothetical protein